MPKQVPRSFTLRPSKGDDTVAIQEAVNKLGTRGGDITFYPGTYTVSAPIKLPSGNTNWMSLRGRGAKVKLNMTPPRFFVWNRTAEHMTFKKFLFEGFSVDAQGKHPATGQDTTWSVFGFDMATGGTSCYGAGYLNIEEVTVKDITLKNVPTQNTANPSDSFNAIDLHFGVAHWGNETVSHHIRDILCDNVKLLGGTRGININGYGPKNCNISLDQIIIRNCYHDALCSDNMYYFGWGTNYHLGQWGHLGHFELTDSYGAHSSDCGVEIDQSSSGFVRNCVIENSNTCEYFITNFSTPLTGRGVYLFENCIARVTKPAENDNMRFGYFGGGNQLGYQGALTIKNSRYETTNTGWVEAVTIPSGTTPYDSVTIDGLTIVAPNVSNPTQMLALRGPIGAKSVSGVTINGKPL